MAVWERSACADPKHPAIRVNSLKFYACATVLSPYDGMSASWSWNAPMNDNIKLYNSLEGETPSSTTDLPPPDTKRWVTRRKAVLVSAVRTGVISLEEVCRRYELSVEEFLAWERAIDTHGVPGLQVTRLQIYRDHPPSRVAKPHC